MWRQLTLRRDVSNISKQGNNKKMDKEEQQDKTEKLETLQRSGQRLKLDNLEHTTDNMDHRNYRHE